MESVLDRRSCKLDKNDLGLYDLVIRDGARVLTEQHNIRLDRAVVEIENFMWIGGTGHE